MEERPAICDVSETSEESWHQYIHEFKADILPIFSRHGISLADALVIWELNKITDTVNELKEVIEDKYV